MQRYTIEVNRIGLPFKQCTICLQLLAYVIIPEYIPDAQRIRYAKELAKRENYIDRYAGLCKEGIKGEECTWE